MSKETEKAIIALSKYLETHPDGDMGALTQQFISEYNAGLQSQISETAYDYLELAQEAKTKKKKQEYLQKALKLEPDNLDALYAVAELNAKYPNELLQALPPLIEKGTALMEEYFRNNVGDFWLVFETRPYMRLRHSYMKTLVECGMMRKACEECEELLRLCTNDNLGVRFELMHLYAYLEEEEAALALHKRYDEYEGTQMLFPLAILYYKQGDMERCISYLDRLCKANKDTKKFFHAVVNDSLEDCLAEMSPYRYRPFHMDELIFEYMNYSYLFDSVGYFFIWARKALRK